MGQLRVGIIGTGFGAAVQIPAFQSLPNVAVVSLLGRTPEKTNLLCKAHNVPHGYSNLDDFFQHSRLDLVSVALPPRAGEICLLKALEYNIPILAEKPLASSFAIASRLADIAGKKKLPTAVDFQFSELPYFKKARTLIEQKSLGSLRTIVMNWNVLNNNHRQKLWSWKTDALELGGVLSLLGSHFLYLAEWFCGPLSRLKCSSLWDKTQIFAPQGTLPAEDTLEYDLNFKNQVSLRGKISNAASSDRGHRWEFYFDEGGIILENTELDYMSGFSLKVFSNSKNSDHFYTPDVSSSTDGRIQPFQSLARGFLESLSSGTSFFPNFSTGTRVQYLMELSQISHCLEKSLEVM